MQIHLDEIPVAHQIYIISMDICQVSVLRGEDEH